MPGPGKSKTKTDWDLHHRLVGLIAERASRMLSNTAKAEVLDAIDEIERRLKKEWLANSKKHQQAKARADGTPKASAWDEID